MKIKCFITIVWFGFMASAMALDYCEVTDVKARQRYPWNGLLDVKCVLEGDGARDYKVTLAVKDEIGGTNLPARTFWQYGGTVTNSAQIVRPGNLHFLWDANADLPNGFECDRVSVKVQVEEKAIEREKVQLWEGGPYWATTNIGAEKPEDYGYYFWWGDTVGYKRENDKWVASDGSNSNFSFDANNMLTYNKSISTLQSEGWILSKNGTYVLAPEYDAAKKHWGGDWRMPTKQEFEDLINKCDWVWTSTNGIYGYIVRGKGDYASNSIFLPCAGRGSWTSLFSAGSDGNYWSSVPDSDNYFAWHLFFYSGGHYTFGPNRDYGQSVRPLQGFVSAPTNVSATDGTSTANVTVTWSAVAGATSYEIWRGTSNSSSSAMKVGTSTSTSYSDTSATPGTTYYYWVKAVASVGTSVFSSCDSGYKKIVAHDKVQLWEGGPYWATTNIGAEKPEDDGYYFWWGDTVGYKRENDKWVASDGSNSNFSFNESNTPTYNKNFSILQSEGWITTEGVLAPEHDAATKHWGGEWRMPTKQEFDALFSECDWVLAKTNGVDGYLVCGRGDYASVSIFFPYTGEGSGTSFLAEYNGNCWSSSFYEAVNGVWYVEFDDEHFRPVGTVWGSGYFGRSVRPVQSPIK
jgi:hypothetical protein